MSTALQELATVHRRLAAVTTIDEAKDLRDQAKAFCGCVKASKLGLQAQNEAARIKFLCERRGGELLRGVRRVQGKRNGETGVSLYIKESGLSTATASDWQALALFPEEELVRLAAKCNEDERELTGVRVYTAARRWSGPDTPAPDEHDGRTRVGDTYLTAIKRFLVAVRRGEETPERLRALAPLLQSKHDEVREALARLEGALEGDGS